VGLGSRCYSKRILKFPRFGVNIMLKTCLPSPLGVSVWLVKLTRTFAGFHPARSPQVTESPEVPTNRKVSANPGDATSLTEVVDFSLYRLGDGGARKASADWLKSIPEDVHAKNLQALRDFDLQAASHKGFEKELSPLSRDAFRKLNPEQKDKVMELTKSFSGEAPLSRLLQEGRLAEKDSSGYSPLDHVHDLVNPNFTLAGNSRKAALKVLKGLEDPGSKPEPGLPNPYNEPGEFARQAGERFQPRL
jgi:hypothetical protein